jgi:hypothetical protein
MGQSTLDSLASYLLSRCHHQSAPKGLQIVNKCLEL